MQKIQVSYARYSAEIAATLKKGVKVMLFDYGRVWPSVNGHPPLREPEYHTVALVDPSVPEVVKGLIERGWQMREWKDAFGNDGAEIKELIILGIKDRLQTAFSHLVGILEGRLQLQVIEHGKVSNYSDFESWRLATKSACQRNPEPLTSILLKMGWDGTEEGLWEEKRRT